MDKNSSNSSFLKEDCGCCKRGDCCAERMHFRVSTDAICLMEGFVENLMMCSKVGSKNSSGSWAYWASALDRFALSGLNNASSKFSTWSTEGCAI